MEPPVRDHLLRTMAVVPPGRRVLVRGAPAGDEGRVAGPLAQMGLEVHAAPWTGEAAQRVHRAAEEQSDATGVYATAAPAGALPYPEAHFGWVVVQGGRLEGAGAEERKAALQALLEEARHHLRPGGWVFVAAPPAVTPPALGEAAGRAALAEAEAPGRTAGRAEGQVYGIYRRVEAHTPP